MDKFKDLVMRNKWISIAIGLLIIIILVWLFGGSSEKSSGSEKSLAKCLRNNGAKFYGTLWCGHCNSQKRMFGDDAKYLPYIECSNSNRSQTKECNDAKITGYPTWIFSDGTRRSGEIPLEQLKQLAGC